MFFHILTIQRQVNWIFCDIAFVEVPLAGLDSVNLNNGSSDYNSVLSIVVFNVCCPLAILIMPQGFLTHADTQS